jgi:anti-sigma factor RsiW
VTDLEQRLRTLLRPEDPACPEGEPAEDLFAYAAGALADDRRRDFMLHLAACRTCRAELEAFHAVDAPPARLPRLVLTVLGLATSAALVFLLVRPPPEADLTPKGASLQIQVGVERGDARLRLPGPRVQRGDRLGLFYSSSEEGALTVVYLEKTGPAVAASRLFGPERVPAGDEVRLEAGAQLEAPADCEWVVGGMDLDLEALHSAAEAAEGCALKLQGASVVRLER